MTTVSRSWDCVKKKPESGPAAESVQITQVGAGVVMAAAWRPIAKADAGPIERNRVAAAAIDVQRIARLTAAGELLQDRSRLLCRVRRTCPDQHHGGERRAGKHRDRCRNGPSSRRQPRSQRLD